MRFAIFRLEIVTVKQKFLGQTSYVHKIRSPTKRNQAMVIPQSSVPFVSHVNCTVWGFNCIPDESVLSQTLREVCTHLSLTVSTSQ